MALSILDYNKALTQNYNNPGAQSYNNVLNTQNAMQNQGQVLGDSTTRSSGGGTRATTPTPAPQGTTQQQSSQQSNLPSIDDLYGQANQYLDAMIPTLQQQQTQGHATVDSNYNTQKNQIASQLTDQQNQLKSTGQKLDQGLGSAYSQAQNTYNQLVQRNLNQYGGRGIGQALNAILGQGYQQNLGQLSNQDLNSHQDLANENQHLSQWGTGQNDQLTNWKNEAYGNIDNIFNQGMNQINQQKYQTEQAKAQAKLGLLNDVLSQRSAVDQYHQQLQSQMAMYGAMGNNAGAYGLSAYSPTGYQSAIQGALSNIAQAPTYLQNYTAQQFGGGGQTSGAGFVPGTMPNSNDLLNQLYKTG